MQAAVDSKQKIIDAQVSSRYQSLQHFSGCVCQHAASLPCGSASAVTARLHAWVSQHRVAVRDRAGQTSAGCDLLSQHSHSYSCFQPWSLAGDTEDTGGGSLWKDHAHNQSVFGRIVSLLAQFEVPGPLLGASCSRNSCRTWIQETQSLARAKPTCFFSLWVVACRIVKLSYCYRLQWQRSIR